MSLEGLGARDVVGGAAGLVEHERLLGVEGRGLSSAALSPRWAVRSVHLAARAHAASQVSSASASSGSSGTMISRAGSSSLVGGLQHRVDEVAQRDVELLVDHPAAHAADPAAAHDELLHGRRELVVLDAEDVGVDAFRQHDGALLEHVLERLDPVAQHAARS